MLGCQNWRWQWLVIPVVLFGTTAIPARAMQPATPVPIFPSLTGDCRTAPRPVAELREIGLAVLPEIERALTDTVAAVAADQPPALSTLDGDPADVATIAAVTPVVEQWFACRNAGMVHARASLLTDQSTPTFMKAVLEPWVSENGCASGDEFAFDGPALLDEYLAFSARPRPLAPELRDTLHELRSVTVLPDGRVLVFAEVVTGFGEPKPRPILLQRESGEYRLVYGDMGASAPATPIAASRT